MSGRGGAGAGGTGPRGAARPVGSRPSLACSARSVVTERGPLLPGEPRGAPTAHTACVLPADGRGALCVMAGAPLSKQHFTKGESLFYVSSKTGI